MTVWGYHKNMLGLSCAKLGLRIAKWADKAELEPLVNIIFKFCYHKSASKFKCPIIIKARQSQTEIEQGQQLIDDIMMNQLDLASLGWAINFHCRHICNSELLWAAAISRPGRRGRASAG